MLPVHGGWNFLWGVLLLCFAAAVPARAEIVVDGRIDESEWESAVRCEDWRRTVCTQSHDDSLHMSRVCQVPR